MTERPAFPPNLALLVSIVAVSTASIFIRLSAAPPMAIATWRMALSTLMLLPFFTTGNRPRRFAAMSMKEKC